MQVEISFQSQFQFAWRESKALWLFAKGSHKHQFLIFLPRADETWKANNLSFSLLSVSGTFSTSNSGGIIKSALSTPSRVEHGKWTWKSHKLHELFTWWLSGAAGGRRRVKLIRQTCWLGWSSKYFMNRNNKPGTEEKQTETRKITKGKSVKISSTEERLMKLWQHRRAVVKCKSLFNTESWILYDGAKKIMTHGRIFSEHFVALIVL